MRRLIIVVEGQTEEEFVNNTLSPYLLDKGLVSITPIKLRTSKTQKGGLIRYAQFKRDIDNYLNKDKLIIVSTLIDFFKLPNSFPSVADCQELNLVDDQIHCLEEALSSNINNSRFIPYIQKHEFEALVFASEQGIEDFVELFFDQNNQSLEHFREVLKEYPNPEDINSRPQFAPSKRLINMFSGYDKVLHGNLLIEEVGIDNILGKCPRFRAWVEQLIEKCNS